MNYFPNQDRRTKLGRPTRYPWDEWTDGKERVLREGENFSCMAESFALLCRRTARVRGLQVTVSTMSVPASTPPVPVEVDGITQWLQPGGTYVLVKFIGGQKSDD